MEEGQNNHTCYGATDEQLIFYDSFRFWVEGLTNLCLCIIGILGNSLSIPVLCSRAKWVRPLNKADNALTKADFVSSKSMDSIFNRLLVHLSVFDNCYLILSIADVFRKHFSTFPFHQYLFCYSLYGLHNIVMTCSIYMTVFLAMERYLAVSRPIEYHNSVNSGKRWLRIVRYALPVLLIAIVSNLPKFFELRMKEIKSNVTVVDDDGFNVTEEHLVQAIIVPTDLRLNQTYSFYYNNAARLVLTGIIPFVLLLLFNYGIYKAVKRRRQCFGGNANTSLPAQHANEENRQAILLFAIVTLFLVFNSPRNFLNIYEVLHFNRITMDYMNGCKALPLWILVVGSVSHILLTINSSVNFFLYCVMSTTFRTELKSLATKVKRNWLACHSSQNNNSGGNNDLDQIRMKPTMAPGPVRAV